MKKTLSLFEVCGAETLGRVSAVLGCMSIAELAAFVLRGILRDAGSFGDAVSDSFIPYVFALGYIGMIWALAWGCGDNRGAVYTLRRLRSSERSAFLVRAAYCIICFAVFMLLQVFLVFVMAFLYRHCGYFKAGSEFLFVSIRAEGFLYALIPLTEAVPGIVNAVCVMASGTAAAYMAVLHRDGNGPIVSYAVPAAVIVLYLLRSLFMGFWAMFGALVILWGICLWAALVYSGDGMWREQ